MEILPYEKEIFLDLVDENGMVVLCEGLGLDRVIINFLRLYCELEHELVLVLNSNANQQIYFMEQLRLLKVSKLPTVLTSSIGIEQRKNFYVNGGVFFGPSSVFVKDFLLYRIPIHLISGIIVLGAHMMTEAFLEPFILRLFRLSNKTGFIKAFTNKPVVLGYGFSQLEKVMKSLFIGKVFFWPRFHKTILSTLQMSKPEVVEMDLQMTESMRKIQTSILEIISACINELRSDNPGLNADEFNVENSLGRSFDKSIRSRLDPVWNELGTKTKRLVSDLRMLRLLLRSLSQYDCITFLNLLESSIGGEKAFYKNPGWIFLDAADNLFTISKKRVFKQKKPISSLNKSDLNLEVCPKWSILNDLIEEIKEANIKTSNTELGNGKVLILCGDMRSVYMIKDVLQIGCSETLYKIFNKIFKKNFTSSSSSTSTESDLDDSDSMTGCTKVLSTPETYIHALYGNSDIYQLNRTLSSVEPRYIIMYDTNVYMVRQLEVYKASRPSLPVRVIFLTYQSSTEEQIYLTSLCKEKQAFNKLISEKSMMVVPKEREGALLEKDDEYVYELPVDTRKGNLFNSKENKKEIKKIIVDIREFRSELPSLIHKSGIELIPLTIQVGDYILSPDICVERKSLSDLIGSLNSGRLYNQCVAMSRTYKNPMLMIEFDANKSFSFKARGVTSRLSLADLNHKMSLLLIHFPRLKLSWCSSPNAAAKLFSAIKSTRENPDSEQALALTVDDDIMDNVHNVPPCDFLLKLPGVNEKNRSLIIKNVKNLLELTQKSVKELSEILGSKINAEQLYEFLHKTHQVDLEQKDLQPKPKKRSLFLSRHDDKRKK